MTAVRRFFGLLLVIASIIGLAFSVLGISFLWRIQNNIATGIQSTVDLLSQTLQTTAQGLDVTYSALNGSVSTIRSLGTTVETIAVTVKSSTPLVEEIRLLMDQDLPETIAATQSSLESAAKSAQVIDSLLSTFSSLPLVGAGLDYNPEVPLSQSLEGVADSLNSLPDSFKSMQDDLLTTTTNLETFESDLSVMAQSIGEIESSVAQYDQVIGGYQQSLNDIQLQLDGVSKNVPVIVRFLLIALTVFLSWMAIANLGLLTQGWELLTENSMKKEVQEALEETARKEDDLEGAREKEEPGS